MTSHNNTFYVTTPIYYVNDKPHLGHVYTTTVADVVARYHRLKGDDTFFLTGVDEHASKVSDKAAEHGVTPQQWADQNAAAFKQTFDKLDLSYNDFVRTSSEWHKQKVTQYIAALLKSGDVYEGQYEGWYDAGQEEYVPDNKAKEYDYKSPVNGKPLIRKTEKNYFFKLSAYRDTLLAHFEKHPTFVQPDARRNEILNRIKEAQDVPISRTGSGGWGIPVPGDPEQTIYVWIDALFNYLSYVDRDDRRHYWQSSAVHFIAKDILWFHACIWPSLLLALSKCPGYAWVNLPKQIYAHSYWVSASGEKMSKSLGNFLDPAAIDNYVAEFGLDALRYFLATRGPLGTTDSQFSPDLFIEVYNSELAGRFGNCLSRVANMTHKYLGGTLEESPGVQLVKHSSDTTPPALADFAPQAFGHLHLITPILEKQAALWMESQSAPSLESDHGFISRYAEAALDAVRAADELIERTQPFKLAKDLEANEQAIALILHLCTEYLRRASLTLWPIMPNRMAEFWRRTEHFAHYASIAESGRGFEQMWRAWGPLQPGGRLELGNPLFPRYVVEKK